MKGKKNPKKQDKDNKILRQVTAVERAITKDAKAQEAGASLPEVTRKISAVVKALETGAASVEVPGVFVLRAAVAIKNGKPITSSTEKEHVVQFRFEKSGGSASYSDHGTHDSSLLAALKNDLGSPASRLKDAARKRGVGRISIMVREYGSYHTVAEARV